MQPYSNIVDDALVNLCESIRSTGDPFSQQKNYKVDYELIETFQNVLQSDDPAQDAVVLQDEYQEQSVGSIVIPDEELNFKVRMLNQKERDVSDIFHNWSKRSVKNLSSISQSAIDPLCIFLTGNAGYGKSFLTKILYQSLTKTCSCRNPELEKPKVLLLAPTGATAINIDVTTIHPALHIPVGYFKNHLPALNGKMRSSLRNKFCEVKATIIDEISMVSNDLLFHIHLRLLEVFSYPNNTPFAGLSIIAVGDFLQLPPVRAKPVYAEYNDSWQKFLSLWNLFEISELSEVMRQRGDGNFIDLLNHVRIAELNYSDVSLLRSKFSKPNDKYPQDALHIFAEYTPAHMHNNTMLNSIENQLY